MEDQTTESTNTSRKMVRQDYADRLFGALVASFTKDLQYGLENFLCYNHIKRQDIFQKFIEENGYSIETARHLAIIERRKFRKQRTAARKEKEIAERKAAREERRRKREEQKQDNGWGAVDPAPEGMFIQFFPKKGDASPTYRGISVKFPDGTNLTLQECTADGLQSLISIYKKRKEAAACSD